MIRLEDIQENNIHSWLIIRNICKKSPLFCTVSWTRLIFPIPAVNYNSNWVSLLWLFNLLLINFEFTEPCVHNTWLGLHYLWRFGDKSLGLILLFILCIPFFMLRLLSLGYCWSLIRLARSLLLLFMLFTWYDKLFYPFCSRWLIVYLLSYFASPL